MTIWQVCKGQKQIQSLKGMLYRVALSKEQAATPVFFNSLPAQQALEDLIEDSKAENSRHYLLTTPFKDPPLKCCSRFGSSDELGIFYGSHSIHTTFTECAYYRLVFRNSIGYPNTDRKFKIELTRFSIDYISDRGIKLHKSPFDKFRSELTDPINWEQTKKIGRAMRSSGVEVFEYESARDPMKGTCVGLFSIKAFKQNSPKSQSQWICDTTDANFVKFKLTQRTGNTSAIRFDKRQFLLNGKLPIPSELRKQMKS